MMSTASVMRSQDTTDVRPVVFPFWMVQEVALDLVEKSALEYREKIMMLELSKYKAVVSNLEKTISNRELQLQLLRKENDLLQSRLEFKKSNRIRNNSFFWLLRLIGALGAGYLIGNL